MLYPSSFSFHFLPFFPFLCYCIGLIFFILISTQMSYKSNVLFLLKQTIITNNEYLEKQSNPSGWELRIAFCFLYSPLPLSLLLLLERRNVNKSVLYINRSQNSITARGMEMEKEERKAEKEVEEKKKEEERKKEEKEGQSHEAARPVPSFENMDLPTELLRGIYGFGMSLSLPLLPFSSSLLQTSLCSYLSFFCKKKKKRLLIVIERFRASIVRTTTCYRAHG